MSKKMKVFRLNGKELCSYTLAETFADEERSTLELLAYENKCKVSDIAVTIEERGK